MIRFKNAKRLTSLLALTTLVFSLCTVPAVESSSAMSLSAAKVTVKVDGSNLVVSSKLTPRKSGSTVLVPAKQFAKKIGAKYKYAKKSKKVTLTKGSSKLVFTVGKKTAKAKTKTVKLKAKTKIVSKMPMVDAITTSKNLGYKTADYVASSNTLYIATAALTGKVVINEVCSTNKTGFVDENNKHSDWIEIYNGTYEDVDLNGYYMTDKAEKPTKAKITGSNTVVKSGEYIIMVCSGNSIVLSTHYTHLNFRIDKDLPETVFLIQPDGKTVVDQVDVPALPVDASYGRSPDATGAFQVFNSPTPGKAN